MREVEPRQLSYEQQAAIDDAFLDEVKRRRLQRQGLIFKTYEPKAEPQMDWTQMNDWFERSFRNLAGPERQWVEQV